MTKAQLIFGDQFSGFDIVLREVEMKRDVHLQPSNYEQYKWQILNAAIYARPNVPDLYEMASIVEEILGITYNREDLDKYQVALNSLVP